MSGPWYTYPGDSPGGGYGEILDPLCQGGKCTYLKPDYNVAVPGGVPITSLNSGVVTDVHDYGGCCGGLSTTVKMDNPPNSLAKYVSYNFLGSADTYVGQRVNSGTKIGTAGSPYGINFALALSADPRWGGPNFKYNAVGDPRLDPRQLLGNIKGGSSVPPSSDSNSGSPDFVTGLTEHVLVFLVALVLIIVGFIIIARPTVEAGAEGAFL